MYDFFLVVLVHPAVERELNGTNVTDAANNPVKTCVTCSAETAPTSDTR